MKKYELFVGIDVSKSKLDVSFVNATDFNQWTHFVVTNTAKGLQGILTRLNKRIVDLKSGFNLQHKINQKATKPLQEKWCR